MNGDILGHPIGKQNMVASSNNDLQSVEEGRLAGTVETEDEYAHLPRAEEVLKVAYEPTHPAAAVLYILLLLLRVLKESPTSGVQSPICLE